MGSMVGRIINRFAERGKVFPNCGPATMEQRVTLVSCKDKDRDKEKTKKRAKDKDKGKRQRQVWIPNNETA